MMSNLRTSPTSRRERSPPLHHYLGHTCAGYYYCLIALMAQYNGMPYKCVYFRYFFKTLCEELGNQVIQEEVSNDMEVLPLWEGKIMAQVKPID